MLTSSTPTNSTYTRKNPIKHVLIFSAFFITLLGLLVAVYVVQTPQDPRSRASFTQESTSIKQEKIDHEDLPPPPFQVEKLEHAGTPSGSSLAAEAPTVVIEKPTNDSVFPTYTSFNIIVKAAHPNGIQTIMVYSNTDLIKTCSNTSTCNFWTNLNNTAGIFTLKAIATAKDSDSNRAESSVKIMKGASTPTITNPTPTRILTSTPSIPAASPTPSSIPATASPLSITIARPLSNDQFPSYFSGVRVDTTVTPSTNVRSVQIYGNGSLLTTCQAAGCGTYWLMSRITTGINTVRIVATDRTTGSTTEKTVTFTKLASITPTGVPTPTPRPTTLPITLTPIATATPPSTTFEIVGSAVFKAQILAGIDLIRREAPTDYSTVQRYVRKIEEQNGNWYYGGTYTIAISTVSASSSTAWAASSIVHEAVHSQNFRTSQPYYSCVGEASSLKAQARFLANIGEYQMAQYVGSMIGSWPPNTDCSSCIQTTCRPNIY